jgi:hypothetical protein
LKIVYYIFFFLIIIVVKKTHAATDSILTKYDDIFVDNNANIYATTSDAIFKYDKYLKLLYTFDYNQYGAPTTIDVHIPMKVVLFFAQYNKILVLDNRMSVVRELDITPISSEFNNTVCVSADNNIWVFDNNKQSLIKYNQGLQILHEYENMNLRMNNFIQSNHIIENNNQLILVDAIHGIYIFDMLGNFVNKIAFNNFNNFQIYENQLFYLENQYLKSIDLSSSKIKVYDILFKGTPIKAQINSDNIIVLYIDKIEIVSLR